jgi:glycosyltransferase involved in cell wall biosynthesis
MKADGLDDILQQERLEPTGFERSAYQPPLIIGFDGKRAATNFTGLGNYSRYVIKILSKYFPENAYKLYIPGELDLGAAGLEVPAVVAIRRPKTSIFKSFWRSLGILRDLKSDAINIYHGLSNELPFGLKKTSIASVVTIHDLIFLRYPQYYPWVDRMIYNYKFGYACRNADKIIAISEQTKSDILKFYHIPESRIEVIYQNCNPAFQQEVTIEMLEKVKNQYNLPSRYLLNVGTIEARKNLLLIVKALKNIPDDIFLVVIGRETSYSMKVREYISTQNLSERILFLKDVSPEDLPAIYRQAEMFIFPSEFEGFGIPIVEALHSGIPVIAATGSCLYT